MTTTSHQKSPKTRIEALREILAQGSLSTQDDLRDQLKRMNFKVTQSTISRDLRKIGAIKAIEADGRTTYRLPDLESQPIAPSTALADLVISIRSNESMIVMTTTPGSASLVARHLDRVRPGGLLGTLAGDDTIFVAPASVRSIAATIRAIEDSLRE